MKVIYRTCSKCKYSLNPTTEKLCLYCREKMPVYDSNSNALFKKGYKPKTFYGKIYKMFTKVYTSPNWKINYVYGSYRKAAEVEIQQGHYMSNRFFERVEQCNGHVTSLSNYGSVIKMVLRENSKI